MRVVVHCNRFLSRSVHCLYVNACLFLRIFLSGMTKVQECDQGLNDLRGFIPVLFSV